MPRANQCPIPRRVRRHLRRLDRTSIETDDTYVAHELPKRATASLVPVGTSGPVEVAPAALARLIEHRGPALTTRRFTHAAGTTIGRVRAALSKTATSIGDILDAAGLDPVILGAQHLDGTDLAIIYELARWDWAAASPPRTLDRQRPETP